MCCAECYFDTYIGVIGNGNCYLRRGIHVVCDRPNIVGEPVIVRGDNVSAITWLNKCAWLNKCGETRDRRVAVLMRLLGVSDMSAGWCFVKQYIFKDVKT